MSKVARFNLENYCHFVTSKTHRNTKIFSEGKAADLLIQTIFEVRKKLRFRLLAFVVMPNHIHLMLVPDKRNSISDVMRHIKGRFARRYNQLSRGINSPDYEPENHRTEDLSSSRESKNHSLGREFIPAQTEGLAGKLLRSCCSQQEGVCSTTKLYSRQPG